MPTLAGAQRLKEALRRAVDIVLLVPADPEKSYRGYRRDPAARPYFDQLAALGRYDNFAFVGIAGINATGSRSNVYIHGKVMLVDDAWATIGSCNLHSYSLLGNTEMNASVVRQFRCDLLSEHLDRDTAGLDDRAALALYRTVAAANRRERDAGSLDWQGLAFSLDPATYAE